MSSALLRVFVLAAVVPVMSFLPSSVSAQELTNKSVLRSIEKGRSFLKSRQQKNGSWGDAGGSHKVGISSLALLALINSGMTIKDEEVRRGLKYLRSIDSPDMTYELSLMISALAAARDGGRDKPLIQRLAEKLEKGQITQGKSAGIWSYSVTNPGGVFVGDRSNGQFAILALRDAAEAGIPISRSTWERAYKHWTTHQSNDGGWGYAGGKGSSTASMTVAGISTLVITTSMLRDEKDLNPDGSPRCCVEQVPDKHLQRGVKWMEQHFAVGHNAGAGAWLLYYLYGLERAGRLSGIRFFGKHDDAHDWYRAGARFLVRGQSQRWGSWQGVGSGEADPSVGTSFALLFLSKGLSPILINKLKYGPRDPRNRDTVLGDDWNLHPNDARRLTAHITGLKGWPKLVSAQDVDIAKLKKGSSGVGELLQSPILYLSGRESPEFSNAETQLLREYVDQGGFIFAVRNCQSTEFDKGFRELIRRMYPAGEARLKRLTAEHPVFRSENLLSPDSTNLYGVDFGCRTPIMYSPDDLSCLWDKWSRIDPPKRPPQVKPMIVRATKIGVNVIAYAAGREPPNKLTQQQLADQRGKQDDIKRGLLEIAKIRHTGGWDTASRSLRNLLLALNRTVGLAASTKHPNLLATDPSIFQYPVLYMHGRNRFQLAARERGQLKKYLDNGGLLFADSCCGAPQFDRSFRDEIKRMFPDRKLELIPVEHELFSTKVGHDIRSVKRRAPAGGGRGALNPVVREVPPFLEAITIDGRLAVIYSKYDISCALDRQASVACTGYVHDDALKIAINVILYAMLQDVNYADAVK